MEVEILNFSLNKTQLHQIKEKCLICEKHKLMGIHLYHTFICSDCEQEIVHTKTSDLNYLFYINRLKKAQNCP
ncbi:sigma factor G inhibitor Gin [Niallia sp. 01092]|uniref:sigma factor G inhibitor Gin n=1 Tax=unclassified Niallia TaxID=2837522 RepID=UPI003FD3D765